jgi:tetratricopeptide (TPR) repeat protein
MTEIERAQALDPASKSVLADKGLILFEAGRQQEASALLKQVEENEPDFISPHRYLKAIYLITADYPHYLVESRSEDALMHHSPDLEITEAAEKGFAAAGGKGMLEAIRLREKELYDRGQFSPYVLAETYSIMGNKQEALHYLKTGYNQHAEGMAEIDTNPAFTNLRAEPAFQRLLAEVGLPTLR